MFMVRMPSSLPTIMVGVNQTIMAALSMVIIAAIIGGFADIGWEVLSTMRKAQTGQSLLAGIVIVLAGDDDGPHQPRLCRAHRRRSTTAAGATCWQRIPMPVRRPSAFVIGMRALARLMPFFKDYPSAWCFTRPRRSTMRSAAFTRDYFG